MWPDEWNAIVDALDELSESLPLLIGVGKSLSFSSGLYKSVMPYTGEIDLGKGLVLPASVNMRVLIVNVTANSLNGSTYIIMRKNETETDLKISIPSEETGNFSQTVDELKFNAGDRLDFVVDTEESTSGTINIGSMSALGFYLLPET